MSEPAEVTPELLRTMPLPFPASDSDKEARGRVLVVGGSSQVPGAVRLAGEAALRAGAGKLQMATLGSLTAQLGLLVPEGRVFSLEEQDGEIAPDSVTAAIGDFVTKCDALLIGPGMIAKSPACAVTERLLETKGPGFVIDAAAMAACWAQPQLVRRHEGRIILTPHAGEMAGLTGQPKEDVAADPLAAARKAAAELGAVVMIKGELTVIAHPDGRGWLHHGHAVGLATSGSGDVLSGVIAGLLARKAAPEVAALWGVWLHQQAGVALTHKVGPLGFLARELPGEIPRLLS
ncbi:MAG TPA: NAD(P)H-hydrate dehydratase [Caulobacteraceae bacterium]|nr:NAD(P)H-hydrate dehydratase [Caulobacteraceae bacterium]